MNSQTILNEILSNRSVFQNLEFDSIIELDCSVLTHLMSITINFKNCRFKKGLKIINLNLPQSGLQFDSCKFDNEIKGIDISDCQLSYLFFSECHFSAFNLYNNQFSNSISIYGGVLNNARFGKNSAVYLNIERLNESTNHILLNNAQIEHVQIIENKKIEKLTINEVKELFCTGDFDSISLNSKQFENIQFSGYFEDGNETKSHVNFLAVNSDFIKGTLNLSGLIINNLTLTENICSSGTILLNDIVVDHFIINDCILKSMYWNNVQFKKKLNITNSEISGLKYSNIGWIPNTKFSCVDLQFDKTFYGKEDRKDIIENIGMLRNDREVYRQLKVAAKGIENHFDALEFYRLEMRLYWKEMRLMKLESKQNRILVFLNRWSSDFGQNWMLPILWLFLFHWLWFSCLRDWDYWDNQLSHKPESAEYFKLLNPTHQVPEYVTTASGYFTDIIMRVSVAFFVYHIIRATRKYGKV